VGAEAIILRNEDVAQPRILQPRAHLLAHELRDLLAHRLIEEEFPEGREPELQRTILPGRLQHGAAPLRRQVRPGVFEVVLEAGEGVR
jgi:hypothetical protein